MRGVFAFITLLDHGLRLRDISIRIVGILRPSGQHHRLLLHARIVEELPVVVVVFTVQFLDGFCFAGAGRVVFAGPWHA